MRTPRLDMPAGAPLDAEVEKNPTSRCGLLRPSGRGVSEVSMPDGWQTVRWNPAGSGPQHSVREVLHDGRDDGPGVDA